MGLPAALRCGPRRDVPHGPGRGCAIARSVPVDQPLCALGSGPATTYALLAASVQVWGRDALEGKGPQRRPQKRLDRRLEGFAKAVGGGYCRLQMLLRLAIGVRGTVAGHRLSALEGVGGGKPPPLFQCIPGVGAAPCVPWPSQWDIPPLYAYNSTPMDPCGPPARGVHGRGDPIMKMSQLNAVNSNNEISDQDTRGTV